MAADVLVSNLMMLKERDRFDAILKEKGYNPVFPEVSQFLSEDEMLEWAGRVDGILAGDDQITRRVLEKALPRLKVISKWGTGIDSIDLVAAKELGIPVCNSPGAFSDAVAEVALGYMLGLSRHIVQIDRSVREGNWPKPSGLGLLNRTLGIIGYGAIGRSVASRALAFSMNVCAYDPYAQIESPVTPCSLQEIFETADVVCLCCNLTEENVHLVNEERLALMDQQSILVNVSRGPLVDEAALIKALQKQAIGGAALDVFEQEPLPSHSEIRSFQNVILGSHNANNLFLATEKVHLNTIENLDAYIGANQTKAKS